MFTERFIDLKEYELSELQDILASAMSELIMLRLESVQSNAERKKDMMIKLQKDLQKAHAYFERRTALCNTEDNIIKTFRYQDDEDRYREKDISVGDLCDYLGFDRKIFQGFGDDSYGERVFADLFNPENALPKQKGFIKYIASRLQNWWHNRWKHHIVYSDSLLSTFVYQVYAHLMKPATLYH